MSILRRLRWPRSARHAKGHAIVLAVILWIMAAVVGFTGTSDRGIAGPLKGADFVQYYTLGHLASSHRIAPMYDGALLHEAQVDLIPESRREIYPPVYPPQTAVMFAPVSGLSYQRALLIWCLLTIVGYALIVWSAWKPVEHLLPDRVLIIAAAAAFPPFWSLVLHGQVTVILLAAFWAGWRALERQRPWLAGLAFGLLAIKPQFGIPLAVVVLVCGEWAMLAGALSSVAAQAGAVWLMLGPEAFTAYAESIPTTIAYADFLEAKPFMSHSLRALTRLTPNWIGLPMWAIVSAIVLWYTVRAWKSHAPLRVRLGVVVLASTLVNPHVIIYDLTVLALPLLWFGSYMRAPVNRPQAEPYWTLVYWLFAATFMPTAAVIGVQASVFILVALLVLVSRAVRADAPTTLADHIDSPISARATAA
jgi:alpha-1,2-mannosyltransferase